MLLLHDDYYVAPCIACLNLVCLLGTLLPSSHPTLPLPLSTDAVLALLKKKDQGTDAETVIADLILKQGPLAAGVSCSSLESWYAGLKRPR